MKIPEIDARVLFDAGHPGYEASLAQVRAAAEDIGFMTLTGTHLTGADVRQVLDAYHRFFKLPESAKAVYNMAKTGSNRGWGAPGPNR